MIIYKYTVYTYILQVPMCINLLQENLDQWLCFYFVQFTPVQYLPTVSKLKQGICTAKKYVYPIFSFLSSHKIFSFSFLENENLVCRWSSRDKLTFQPDESRMLKERSQSKHLILAVGLLWPFYLSIWYSFWKGCDSSISLAFPLCCKLNVEYIMYILL